MAKKGDNRWHGDTAPLNTAFDVLSPLASPAAPPDTAGTGCAGIRLPKVKSARIERANRGGKTVTVVTFHGFPSVEQIEAWLKSARKLLGIGGSVEGSCAILQGDQCDRVKTV